MSEAYSFPVKGREGPSTPEVRQIRIVIFSQMVLNGGQFGLESGSRESPEIMERAPGRPEKAHKSSTEIRLRRSSKNGIGSANLDRRRTSPKSTDPLVVRGHDEPHWQARLKSSFELYKVTPYRRIQGRRGFANGALPAARVTRDGFRIQDEKRSRSHDCANLSNTIAARLRLPL